MRGPLGTAAFISRFHKHTAGNVGAAFGLTILPLMATVGGAIDFRMAQQLKSAMQSATDAAILAAMSTRYLSDSQRADRAMQIYTSNIAGTPAAKGAVPKIDIANGTGTITVKQTMPTAVLRVVGISALPVEAKSTARAYPRRIEMSLMTDVTGSMADPVPGGVKIDGLKLAARDLLEIVLPDDMPAGAARVALIPFANYVNAGQYASEVTSLPETRNLSGVTESLITCVTERTGKEAYTDAAPGPSAYLGASHQGKSGASYTATGACMRSGGGSSSALPAVMPLTDDRSSLLSVIDTLTPAGSTAGHLGTAWAWYAISSNWNPVWNLPTPIASNSDTTAMKVAVLMTDGEYNTQYASTDSKSQALALCKGMKDAGITVYTVGFGMSTSNPTDIAAMDTLSKCASSKDTFFVAYDGNALRDVFKAIAGKVANLNAVLVN